MENKARNF